MARSCVIVNTIYMYFTVLTGELDNYSTMTLVGNYEGNSRFLCHDFCKQKHTCEVYVLSRASEAGSPKNRTGSRLRRDTGQ